MGFGGVFSNINYSQIPQARQMEASRFQQAIGQGIARYNQKQNRELKSRQLDMKAKADKAKADKFDLKGLGEKAAYEIQIGAEQTPERLAAIQAWSAMKPPVVGVGGRPMPSMAEQVLGSNAPQEPINNMPVDNGVLGGEYNVGGSSILPVIQNTPIEDMGASQGYNISSPAGSSPKTLQATEEANLAIKKQQALDRIVASRSEREFQLKKQRNRPVNERLLYGASQEWRNIDNNINKAIEQVSPWSAGLGSYLSVIPSSSAKDLSSTIKTIGADSAFTKLIEMKKSGGTLGAISGTELELLKSAVANLETDQSPEQLIENLNNYKALRREALDRISMAYKDEYGKLPQDIIDLMGNITPKTDYKSKYGLQ